MNNFEYNLIYAQVGVLELKNYLLSKELFWPIHISNLAGHSPYPKLTIGNLLFYLKRADACIQNPSQEIQHSKVEDDIYALSVSWRSAWEGKAEKEFRSRQRQWQNYLTEIRSGDHSPVGNYKTEVRLRVLLALLSEKITVKTEVELQVYDQALRSKFVEGEFIWDEDYASGFPIEKYWFIYGKLN